MRAKSYAASKIEQFSGEKLTSQDWARLTVLCKKFSKERIIDAADMMYHLYLDGRTITMNLFQSILNVDRTKYDTLTASEIREQIELAEMQGSELLGGLIDGDTI